MARVISSDCISCGSCVQWCLQDAIVEGDGQMVINEKDCVDCALCEEKCPIGAISRA